MPRDLGESGSSCHRMGRRFPDQRKGRRYRARINKRSSFTVLCCCEFFSRILYRGKVAKWTIRISGETGRRLAVQSRWQKPLYMNVMNTDLCSLRSIFHLQSTSLRQYGLAKQAIDIAMQHISYSLAIHDFSRPLPYSVR